jgi:hypothetical protein
MNNQIQNIYNLYNNPFILTPLLIEFYKNYDSRPNSLLLADLIFPFVLYAESRDSLQTKTTKRTLITFRKENDRLFGLHERVNQYKILTKLCLQYSVDNKFIEINKELSVIINKVPTCDTSLFYSSKAAGNLAIMLKRHDIIAVFRLLGIKRI